MGREKEQERKIEWKGQIRKEKQRKKGERQ